MRMNKENDSSYYQLRGKIRQLKSISYVFAVVEFRVSSMQLEVTLERRDNPKECLGKILYRDETTKFKV